MTCKRCEDIHLAQKNGKTHKSCQCDCHDNNNDIGTVQWSAGTAWTPTDTGATTDYITLSGDATTAYANTTAVTGVPTYPCSCKYDDEIGYFIQCDICKEHNVPLCTCSVGKHEGCDICGGDDSKKPNVKRGGERRFKT